MSHELKEICTLSYQHKSVQPFSIQTSPTGIFSIMTKTAVQIMRPEFKYNPDLNLFNLKPAVISCPQAMPTNELDTEEVEIYNNADKMERKSLLLDQRFLPKLSNKEFDLVQSRSVAWSNHGCFAYLSTYGGLEIFRRIPGDNEWESILDVGKEYLKYLLQGKTFPLKTMNELNTHVEDILLTSLCFCIVGSEELLLATTKSNKIVAFRINFEQKSVEIASVSDLSQHQIIVLKPFSKQNEVFLAAGSMDGQICVYKVNKTSEVTLKCCLWDDKDLLAVTSIEVTTLDDGFFIIASKGGHLLAFNLDLNMNCTSKTFEMVTSMPITGLMKVEKTSYIVVSLDGCVKSVNCLPNALSIPSNDVQLDFSLPGTSFYGIIPSFNQAYFVLVSFVTQAHDHLTLRQPLNLTLCRLACSNPIDQLLSSSSLSLTNATDNIELIRYLSAKDQKLLLTFEKSLNISHNIGFTKEFLFRIKVFVILAGARYTYFRLRSSAEADVSFKRMGRLGQILEVIRSSNVLALLLQKESITDFERLSGRCLRLSLLEYIAVKPATDEFLKIYDFLTPELMILVQRSEHLASSELECCSVCSKNLDINSLMCKEGHFVMRCCVSKVQIEEFNHKMCSQCQRCICNDVEKLKNIVSLKEDLLLCPLCDVSFENKVQF